MKLIYDPSDHSLAVFPKFSNMANQPFRKLSVFSKVIFCFDNFSPEILKLQVPSIFFLISQFLFNFIRLLKPLFYKFAVFKQLLIISLQVEILVLKLLLVFNFLCRLVNIQVLCKNLLQLEFFVRLFLLSLPFLFWNFRLSNWVFSVVTDIIKVKFRHNS